MTLDAIGVPINEFFGGRGVLPPQHMRLGEAVLNGFKDLSNSCNACTELIRFITGSGADLI